MQIVADNNCEWVGGWMDGGFRRQSSIVVVVVVVVCGSGSASAGAAAVVVAKLSNTKCQKINLKLLPALWQFNYRAADDDDD